METKYHLGTDGKVITYTDATIWLVYCRRSNGKRKLLSAGVSLPKAMEIYTSTKVFVNDLRYLYRRDSKETPEALVIRESGKEFRKYKLLNRKKMSGKYDSKMIGPFKNVPISVAEELPSAVYGIYLDDGSFKLSVNNLVQLMFAAFIAMNSEEKEEFLDRALKELNKHKKKCGLVSPTRDKKELIENMLDDLL